MAILAKRTSAQPSKASNLIAAENQIDGLAGENIAAGDLLCIEQTTGLIFKYKSPASSSSSGDRVVTKPVGVAGAKATAGEIVTIYKRAAFGYSEETGSDTVVPGKPYYASTTAGAIADTVPTTGHTGVVAYGHPKGKGILLVDC